MDLTSCYYWKYFIILVSDAIYRFRIELFQFVQLINIVPDPVNLFKRSSKQFWKELS